jgi:hypothetical protein
MDPDPPPQEDAIIPPQAEQVTVNRRERVETNPEIRGQSSAGKYGCLGSIAIWTIGWLAVAFLAISRASRVPDGPEFIGAFVSGLVAIIGCRISLGLLRKNSPGLVVNFSSYVSMPRRATGWITAIFWAAFALGCNLSIFWLLLDMAKAGRGWMILFLLFWSLIGLVLLFILITGIGVVIDSRSRENT